MLKTDGADALYCCTKTKIWFSKTIQMQWQIRPFSKWLDCPLTRASKNPILTFRKSRPDSSPYTTRLNFRPKKTKAYIPWEIQISGFSFSFLLGVKWYLNLIRKLKTKIKWKPRFFSQIENWIGPLIKWHERIMAHLLSDFNYYICCWVSFMHHVKKVKCPINQFALIEFKGFLDTYEVWWPNIYPSEIIKCVKNV